NRAADPVCGLCGMAAGLAAGRAAGEPPEVLAGATGRRAGPACPAAEGTAAGSAETRRATAVTDPGSAGGGWRARAEPAAGDDSIHDAAERVCSIAVPVHRAG